MTVYLIILIVTVILLVLDVVRIDMVAILSMLALGWSGILTQQEMLSGFSSNAVIAMMGVMILGRGIAATGLTDRFSRFVLRKAGQDRKRLIGWMSLSVGILSGFIQNIGAAALFLPGILTVSRRGKIPASALIMPIGFAAILGGSLSMVGSGPLILVNDLLRNAGMKPYGLFSVTPLGMLLLLGGIGFFLLFGERVLPRRQSAGQAPLDQEKLIAALHLPRRIGHYAIPAGSGLVGKTAEQSGLWHDFNLYILALSSGRELEYAPWRETRFAAGQELALLGKEADARRFAALYGLEPIDPSPRFADLRDPEQAGFAEIIVPPRSELVGQTIRRYSLRKRYAVEPVMVFSKGREIRGDFSDHSLLPGDTIVVYGLWEFIDGLKGGPDFVVATPFSVERKVRAKAGAAVVCFLSAILLAFSGAPIAMAFFSGAAAMVLTGVLTIREAYQAIEWKVVFLLAGLIPLGIAMEKTGTATYLAQQAMTLVADTSPLLVLAAVALLATLFSLFMSNVGAIVVLAPLISSFAAMSGMDPRPLVLMAAVCAGNAFILPTHQVNALLMSPGGYRNADYIRAGSGITVMFLLLVVIVFYLFYI